DGRGLAAGFYQAIVLGERGPTLNINNNFCCFYQNYNLVEFISCYLGQDIRRNGKFIIKKFCFLSHENIFSTVE
ncbi:unnamed protein product, partial [Rotaria sp. Silwood2]